MKRDTNYENYEWHYFDNSNPVFPPNQDSLTLLVAYAAHSGFEEDDPTIDYAIALVAPDGCLDVHFHHAVYSFEPDIDDVKDAVDGVNGYSYTLLAWKYIEPLHKDEYDSAFVNPKFIKHGKELEVTFEGENNDQ